MPTLPVSQIEDAHELESKGIREFFKVEFKDAENSVMFLTPHATQVFLNVEWESFALKMNGVGVNSSGEVSRPKLSFVNPNGVFSKRVSRGEVEGALVSRFRILISDLEAGNHNSYMKQVWQIGKILSLGRYLCVTELRSVYDGHSFKLPARAFYPPEFPHVTLR